MSRRAAVTPGSRKNRLLRQEHNGISRNRFICFLLLARDDPLHAHRGTVVAVRVSRPGWPNAAYSLINTGFFGRNSVV
jgi:hypothetical protein